MKNVQNKENRHIKVSIYIRVSTQDQARHGYSLQAQRERLIEFCKERNYQIVEIYADEGKSARSKLKSRTELLRLIEDAKKKKFNRIVFWRLDRWFRNISDYYKIQEILESNQIDWECSDEQYDTYSANGRLNLNVKLSIAQNESDQTGERIRFDFENMIKNGRAINGTGQQPFGYMVTNEKKNKRVVKNPETSQIVYDMFDYMKKTGSIRATERHINEKYNLKIEYNSMRRYLQNEKYCGMYRGNENYCEAYISKEEFKEIQSLIIRNTRQNKRYDYIFSGLLICPKCGRRLSGNMTIKRQGNIILKIPSYRCNRAKNDKLCDYHKIPGEKTLEKFLLNEIRNVVENIIISSEKFEEAKEKRNKIDVKKINDKLNRLTDLYIDGMIDRDRYNEQFEKLNSLLHTADEEEKKEKHRDLKKYKEFLKSDYLKIYNKLNNKSKRMFWAKYIDYIIQYEDGSYHIELN